MGGVHHEGRAGETCGACVDIGVGPVEVWRRGLKMRTTTSPKMMSKRRKMHFRLPVFFWYLSRVGTKKGRRDQTLIVINHNT